MASNFPVHDLDLLWQIEDVGELRVATDVEFGHNDFGNPMPSKGRSATGIAWIWIRPSALLLGMLVWSSFRRSAQTTLRWAVRRPPNYPCAARCRAIKFGRPFEAVQNRGEKNVKQVRG